VAKFSLFSKRDRIKTLIAKLEKGEAVQARDVNLVLTPEQRKQLDAEWALQKKKRQPIKPELIASYEQSLKVALMWQGRLEQYKASNPTTYKVYVDRNAVQAEHERKVDEALKQAKADLKKIVASKEELNFWLDRQVASKEISILSIDQMPRSITSRSNANKSKSLANELLGVKSKMETKIVALKQALAQVESEIKEQGFSLEVSDEEHRKLKEILKVIKQG
jgi:vacuolar-type H+-ATPase subunit I/STV1